VTFSDRVKALVGEADAEQNEPPKRDRKAQWVPGIEWKGDEGEVTTLPMEGDNHPDWSSILKIWGLDPEQFSVVEPVLFNVWGSPDGILNRQWKGKVIRNKPELGSLYDLEALRDEIKRHKPKKVQPLHGEGVFNVVLADWQIGKSEGGGSQATAKRVLDAIEAVKGRVDELRRLKRPLGTLQIIWTGDSVEGCLGHYEMQTFSVDLDRRAQVNAVRTLLLEAIRQWSPHFEKVRIVAVGGNHGENRSANGKAFTTLADNDDLAVIDQVKDALEFNPEVYGHVETIIAPDHLSLTVETAGWILGLTHGHTARSGGTAEQKLKTWLSKMALGRQPIGESDILITGHYHHLRQADWGSVHWIQAPALDGGSEWFRMTSGEHSEAGVLTFATYPEAKVKDLQIL
jgi:predicted phosphodiesterase